MLWRLSFFLALLACTSVNAVEVKPYIVNGTTATVSDYPSFASLFYRDNTVYSTRSFCGATMINSQYVLTAAHCVYGDDDMMLYTVVAPQLQDESQFLSNEQARAAEFYYPDTFINSSVELWPDDIEIIKIEKRARVYLVWCLLVKGGYHSQGAINRKVYKEKAERCSAFFILSISLLSRSFCFFNSS